MMSHVSFRAIQEPLEFQTIRVSVGDHITDLADDGREYEDTDQIADYREDVPANQEGRKRTDQSRRAVIRTNPRFMDERPPPEPFSSFSSLLLAFFAFAFFFRSLSHNFSPSLSLSFIHHIYKTHTNIHSYIHIHRQTFCILSLFDLS